MPVLRELYERVVELAPGERAAWLDAHCPDATLRRRLQAMFGLSTGGLMTDLLERPAIERLAALGDEPEPRPEDWIGRTVGAFRLGRMVGEGGMAVVFLGHREGADFDQRVAVKLLRRGLYSSLEQALFRRERQALAALSHPNIARLIDGGVTDTGVPYLAMEYVDGVPLTRWCNERRLDLRERLALMRVVCRAVDAAHRALIVHRDLKPSNILVAADGTPKLLDFGIAKLLDEGAETTRTGFGALTPEYAAPEQFGGGPITTATDVYALGVLLHELLLGVRPAREATRRPSQLAGERTTDLWALPAAPLTLRRQLRGDLDNIMLKALDAEPTRRYPSAGALADDLQRHLDGQPVTAHPPSAWYRTRKFVQRHRGGVALSAILVLGILASLALALWQARVAQRHATRANAVREFVVELLRKSAPDRPQAERPDLPTLVYTAAASLPAELGDEPEIRIELLATLGNVLRHMRDLPRSEALLRDAERGAEALAPDATLRQVVQAELARTLLRRGDPDGAAARVDALLAAPRLPAELPRATLLKLAMAIEANRARTERAVALGAEMIDSYRTDCAAGRRCTELGFAEHDYAMVLLGAGRVREAQALLTSALARKRILRLPLTSVAETLNGLSYVATYRGDLDQAETHAREALRLQRSLGNSVRTPPLATQQQIAEVLLAKEAAAEARAQLDTLLQAQRERGTDRCALASTQMLLARAQLLEGEHAGALATARGAIAAAATCPPYSRLLDAEIAELVAGRALAAAGARDEAAGTYQRALRTADRFGRSGPNRQLLLRTEAMRLAAALGRRDETRRHARELIALLDRFDAAPHAPLRLEAELLGGSGDRSTRPERLARIAAWPVARRLQALSVARTD